MRPAEVEGILPVGIAMAFRVDKNCGIEKIYKRMRY